MTNDDSEIDLDFDAGFEEARINGKAIYWRHWVCELPTLTAFEFSRLNAAIDPDRYADFLNRTRRVADHAELVEKVAKTERLAKAQGMVSATVREWIEWAESKKIRVYFGLRCALDETSQSESGIERKATNQKRWGETQLLELLREYDTGVTQTALAKKHGFTRQRIGALLKEARNLKRPSFFQMANPGA